MRSKPVISQTDVQTILSACADEASRQGWAVSISVVDDGGHPLGFTRLDGAAPASSYISTEKARAAALGRRETKLYEEMINGGRTAFLSAGVLGALEGGVPILVEGAVVGAVGVSGAKPDQDAAVAKAGVGSHAG
ncbi:heme-binding protein [Paraburkholderia sp. BR13439]|uniref:GlcG/HbpS family heme-binding protein n=1 Tax=unclassified Paraburkholderia TaxID=2615204 RepID=UPI0034CECBF1